MLVKERNDGGVQTGAGLAEVFKAVLIWKAAANLLWTSSAGHPSQEPNVSSYHSARKLEGLLRFVRFLISNFSD